MKKNLVNKYVCLLAFYHSDCRFLEAIEKDRDCAFYYFLLGKLYWEMNGNLRADKKKCLAQFLKVEIIN